MDDKDYEARAQAHIAAIKKSSKAMVEDAVVRAAHKVMAEFEAKSDGRLMEPPAQQEPEFFTHCVDQPYDWSEWVCPDPKSYLFKCCDCGLVHEAEFGVVRYKSETEREDCDMVNDPNLQAVFRMRRSEQWSPADMAHRAGGLTMEQPAQQCRTDGRCQYAIDSGAEGMGHCPKGKCVMPAQQELVAWPAGLIERIKAAEQRIQDGHAPRRIPADPTDIDLVLAEVRYLLEGKQPPFWVNTSPHPAQRKPLTEYEIDCIRFGITAAHHTEHAIKLTRAIEAAHGIGEKK